MRDCPGWRLSRGDLAIAEDEARARHGSDRANGWKQQGGQDQVSFERAIAEEILGAEGELACSQMLRLAWTGKGDWKRRDVGDCLEVRSRSEPWHDLLIKPPEVQEKPGVPFVLVIREPWGAYWFPGWDFARNAPSLGAMRPLRQGGKPAWVVPQGKLRPIYELIDLIRNGSIAATK